MIRLLRVIRELRSMQSRLNYTRTEKDNTSRRGRREGGEGHTHMYILSWSIYLSTYVRRLCIWCNYSIVASTMSISRNSPFITAPSVRFKSMTLYADCRAPSLSLSLSFSLPTWPRVEKKNPKKQVTDREVDGAKKVEKKMPIFIHSFFHTFMHVPYS